MSFKRMVLSGVAFALGALAAFAVLPAEARATEPAGQAIGFYSNGRLAFATPLPADGPGYTHLFRLRDRGWATQGLIELIESSTAAIAADFPGGERLQIGDLAAQHGGPISGHVSHQVGLDGDFVFFRNNHQEQDPAHVTGFVENFVIGGKPSPNFDTERNWAIIRLIQASGRLNRIFVDPAIKKGLCEYAHLLGDFSDEAAETLRHLEPLSGHFDHMHVRLTCPVESPRCTPQSELPPGDGCALLD